MREAFQVSSSIFPLAKELSLYRSAESFLRVIDLIDYLLSISAILTLERSSPSANLIFLGVRSALPYTLMPAVKLDVLCWFCSFLEYLSGRAE